MTGPTGAPATPGATAYGELYIDANTMPLLLPTQNAWVQLTTGWVVGINSGTTPSAGSSDITADTLGIYHLTCSLSQQGGGPHDFEFAIFKNGLQLNNFTGLHATEGTAVDDVVTLSGLVALAVNDVVDVRIRCRDINAASITITNANLAIHACA